MEAENTQVVKDAYAAFGRADIPAILATLDDNVEWHGVIGAEGVMPTAGLRRGREAVGEFFQQVAGSIQFDSFEPQEFIAQGDQVAVVGRYQGLAKPTGKEFESPWVMVFTVSNGKIVRFREFTDSRQLAGAFQ